MKTIKTISREILEEVEVKGIGCGCNEKTKILQRNIIEEIIANLDPYEVFSMAYNFYSPNYKSGECQIDLRTGKLTGGAYGTNEQDQACDSVNIVLFRIDQNSEIKQFGHCGCDYEGTDDCKCEVLIDEDGSPYDIFYFFPNGQNFLEIARDELEDWYDK